MIYLEIRLFSSFSKFSRILTARIQPNWLIGDGSLVFKRFVCPKMKQGLMACFSWGWKWLWSLRKQFLEWVCDGYYTPENMFGRDYIGVSVSSSGVGLLNYNLAIWGTNYFHIFLFSSVHCVNIICALHLLQRYSELWNCFYIYFIIEYLYIETCCIIKTMNCYMAWPYYKFMTFNVKTFWNNGTYYITSLPH